MPFESVLYARKFREFGVNLGEKAFLNNELLKVRSTKDNRRLRGQIRIINKGLKQVPNFDDQKVSGL